MPPCAVVMGVAAEVLAVVEEVPEEVVEVEVAGRELLRGGALRDRWGRGHRPGKFPLPLGRLLVALYPMRSPYPLRQSLRPSKTRPWKSLQKTK